MVKTWTLYKRELGDYFNSPMAYIAIVAFVLVAGVIGLAGIFGAEPPRAELRPLFKWMPLIMVFIAPAIAMRLLSEEKSSGTMELLITMPVTDWQVVLAKYFSAFTVLFVAVLCTVPIAVTVAYMGALDKGVAVAAYLGVLLMGACYVAIGLMTSSWVKSQVVAFILGGVICGVFWALGSEYMGWMPDGVNAVLRQVFGLGYHFNNISKGILDSRDVIYYASLAVAALVFAQQSLESRKWR
jgi:ABC-2 type transport system permease protein